MMTEIPPEPKSSEGSGASSSRIANLDWARHAFAFFVLFSHGFALIQWRLGEYFQDDPLTRWCGVSLGEIGVYGFFMVSGYVIPLSRTKSTNGVHFFWKRALRTQPAVWFMVLMVAGSLTSWVFPVLLAGGVVAGHKLAVGRREGRVTDRQYWGAIFGLFALFLFLSEYLGFGLSLGHETLQILTLGVPSFRYHTEGPWASMLAGQLWTLRFEELCYAMVALLWWITWKGVRLYESRKVVVALFVFSLVGDYFLLASGGYERQWLRFGDPADNMQFYINHWFQLAPYFLGGSIIYLFRSEFRKWFASPRVFVLSMLLVAFGLKATIAGRPLAEFILPLLSPIALFSIATGEWIRLPELSFRGQKYDLSYSCFLWHFAALQWLANLNDETKMFVYAPGAIFVTTILCVGVGSFSWSYVEEPAMRLKRWVPTLVPAKD
jgi:peptidoglycan/LPS O-acetylase OafA/YrhL